MADADLPDAIARMIDATNRGDSSGFVASFAQDATITDFGRVFHGHEGARSWNGTDNIGVGMHFAIVETTERSAQTFDVVVDASSRRFSGRTTLTITTAGGLITSLTTS